MYSAVFFDLDRTLWDFESNAKAAFEAIFVEYNLKAKGIPSSSDFYEKYSLHNNELWNLYNRGEIIKETLKTARFILTLLDYKINDDMLSIALGDSYLKYSLTFNKLFPGAEEIISYLKKSYKLGIITNGFEEIQYHKLKISGLNKYFDVVITSEEAGFKKPNPRIFEYALSKINAKAEESIMIGDDIEIDILGAKNAGISQIYFNPEKNKCPEANFSISDLNEIKTIL
ncbi:MAG: YjjG family noncanonical pyrimidine nucleotidase [Bacteroidota bacterium]